MPASDRERTRDRAPGRPLRPKPVHGAQAKRCPDGRSRRLRSWKGERIMVSAPDRLRPRAGRSAWSIEPSDSSVPSCSTVTLQPRARTKSRSCSTTTTRWRPAMRASSLAANVRSRRRSCRRRVRRPASGRSPCTRHHADLEPLLLAVGEDACHVMGTVGQADLTGDFLDAGAAPGRRGAASAGRRRGRAGP